MLLLDPTVSAVVSQFGAMKLGAISSQYVHHTYCFEPICAIVLFGVLMLIRTTVHAI